MTDPETGEEPIVLAAGGVVWRRARDTDSVPAPDPDRDRRGDEDGDGNGSGSANGVQVLLVHRPKYDDWSLPKGKNDPGERDEDAAFREVLEETGLRCVLGDELQTVFYVDSKGRPKQVRYWVMTPTAAEPGDPGFSPNEEIDELAWLDLPAARARLSYDRDRVVLDGFKPPTSPAAP